MRFGRGSYLEPDSYGWGHKSKCITQDRDLGGTSLQNLNAYFAMGGTPAWSLIRTAWVPNRIYSDRIGNGMESFGKISLLVPFWQEFLFGSRFVWLGFQIESYLTRSDLDGVSLNSMYGFFDFGRTPCLELNWFDSDPK